MFLQAIANIYYEKYGDKIHELTFVFPNHRAGIFFRKYLSLAAGKSIMGPEITTIDTLFEKLAANLPRPLKKKEPIKLLFDLFKIYQSANPNATLDEFIFWGKMLLGDFNEIDLYMVDAHKLFSNVSDLRDMSLLTEEEDRVLRDAFFNVFGKIDEKEESEDKSSTGNVKKTFIRFWNQLITLYDALHDQMLKEGYVSSGLLHRQVVNNLSPKTFRYLNKHFVFIGFNAINKSERELMKFMRDNMVAPGRVDFIWDYNLPEELQGNEALQYKANNLENFPMPADLPLEKIPHAEYPEIELIDVASTTGQTTVIRHFLSKVLEASDSQHELYKTAIVLPDTTMLLPTLYAIPGPKEEDDEDSETSRESDKGPTTVLPINVTMGYPISSAPVMALIKHIAQLHQTSRITKDGILFYHKPVLAILHAINTDGYFEPLINNIISENKTYVNSQYFIQEDAESTEEESTSKNDILKVIFRAISTTDEAIRYLDELVTALSRIYTDTLNQEPLTRLSEIIETLSPLKENGMCENINTFFRILLELLNGMLLPFQGEPLQGLQIMGVLETRALDFDNIFIASVNEEVFPGKPSNNSFIPNQLRKAFCMPLPEYKDGIFAYNFYRMIFHAKKVFLVHNTIADALTSGEVSRYVHQLTYLYADKVRIKREVAHLGNVIENKSTATSLTIAKTPEVLEKVKNYLQNGISPSAIKDFASCQLMFYLKNVMQMSETEMNDDMQNNELGNIVHQAMQWLYEGNDGTRLHISQNDRKKEALSKHELITEAKIDEFIHIVEHTDFMKRAYMFKRLHAKETDTIQGLEGRDLIYTDIAKRMTLAILHYEKSLLSHATIHSPLCEVSVSRKLRVNNIDVKLKGIIDHLDIYKDANCDHEVIRSVDYKTGHKNASFNGENIEDLFSDSKSLNALQVLLYCYILQDSDSLKNTVYSPYLNEKCAIQPHIYSSREMLTTKHEEVKTAFLPEATTFNSLMPQFETELIKLLEKILDPEKPFAKPEEKTESCKYCAFSSVCASKSSEANPSQH